MMDLRSLNARLVLGDDGIWYTSETVPVSYPASGNEACYRVEDSSFWFKHRNECIISVVSLFPPVDRGAIFDIGGGNGFVSLALARAGYEVVVVEPGKDGAHHARERGLENVVCASIETAGFPSCSLPAIGLFDVLEHIEDDLGFLKRCAHLLQNGGRIYVGVPAYNCLWSHEDVLAGHFRRYTLKNLCALLESCELVTEFATYIFRFLPVPIALFRTLPYRLGLARSHEKIPEVPRGHDVKGKWTQNVVERLLRKEVCRLQQKKPIRMGSSCLLVAQKKSGK